MSKKPVQPTKKEEEHPDDVDYGAILRTIAAENPVEIAVTDLMPPFLRIAQGLSPVLKTKNPEHIPGIKVGDVYHSALNVVLPQGTEIIPLGYVSVYVEYVPRPQGGGYRGTYATTDYAKFRLRKIENTDYIQEGSALGTPGNELIQTDMLTALVFMPDGTREIAVFPFQKTLRGVFKRFLTKIRNASLKENTPFFGRVWRMNTIETRNKKGEWYTYDFKPGELLKDHLSAPAVVPLLRDTIMPQSNLLLADLGGGKGLDMLVEYSESGQAQQQLPPPQHPEYYQGTTPQQQPPPQGHPAGGYPPGAQFMTNNNGRQPF